ncbi:excalibur calcium-binding domain-containing protein [Mycobacterium sp. 23]|uniref:excalibur calcium-binding domain-containing protein n=1 Tax=Mycobacterium sp. 23 TaxID=3400424 RepID=UPI003AADA8AA
MADPLEINCTQFNEDGSCYWANCTQAKANGECNIREGSAHYCAKQDRDGDGLACEC